VEDATPEIETAGELDVPHAMSWADEARDLGAWMGNAMQINALQELYGLEKAVKAKSGSRESKLLSDWRKLTTSDHFYYMSTKEAADGGVHAYFRPYDSPYDAYINFMNILDSVRARVG
jgi:alpha-amylase